MEKIETKNKFNIQSAGFKITGNKLTFIYNSLAGHLDIQKGNEFIRFHYTFLDELIEGLCVVVDYQDKINANNENVIKKELDAVKKEKKDKTQDILNSIFDMEFCNVENVLREKLISYHWFTSRVIQLFYREEIYNLRQLITFSRINLLKFDGLGLRTLYKILDILDAFDLKLVED